MLIKGPQPPETHMVVQWSGPFYATVWNEHTQIERSIKPGENVRLRIEVAHKLLADKSGWWRPAARMLDQH